MPRPLWRLPLITALERVAAPGRPRVPEPMVMDDPKSVAEFHAGGESIGAMQAVYDLSARALDVLVPPNGRLLDLGVGSGRALQHFLAMRSDVTATALDLAPNMLATARRFLDENASATRVTLLEADMTALPDAVTAERWDAVSCVWSLHHLPDRDLLRSALRQVAEIRERHGSAVWLLDFQRLRRADTVRAMAAAVQPHIPPVLHADGIASEAAAFTHEELRTELAAAGLDDLRCGRARPIPWLQAFWCDARMEGDRPAAGPRTCPVGLTGSARVDAALLRRGFSQFPR